MLVSPWATLAEVTAAAVRHVFVLDVMTLSEMEDDEDDDLAKPMTSPRSRLGVSFCGNN